MNTALSINDAISRLKSNSKITNFSIGSISRSFIETYANIAAQEADATEQKIVNLMITNATGKALDDIGSVFGLSRKKASYPQGYITVKINTGFNLSLTQLLEIAHNKTGIEYTNIVIPAGTMFANEDESVIFTSLSDLTLTEDTNTVNILSTKVSNGEIILANTLNKIINPPNALLFIAQYLTITNEESITNGDTTESDANFRYRLANFYLSNANANNIAIRLSALSVNGVSDVRLTNYRYGIGTTDILVISQDPITSDGLLAAVRQAVSSVKAASEEITVSSPRYIGLTYRIRVEFKISSLSNTEKDSIIADIQEKIIKYINSLSVGKSLIFSDLTRIILSNENIKTYYIDRAARGEYNKSTGLIDYTEPILLVDQNIDDLYKFVANFKTIVTCY